MNKFEEILEFRTIDQRVDFLEYLIERGLSRKEKKDITPIIKNCFAKYNDWTLVLLIDLTNQEKIVSNDLIDTYIGALFNTKTFYIKLSILDYIRELNYLYKKANIYIDFSMIEKLAYSKRDKLIVRNQALLILMKESSDKQPQLLSQLNININKSEDYRNHIRLYNTLLDNSFYEQIPKKEILKLIKISKTKSFGKSVQSIINELELVI